MEVTAIAKNIRMSPRKVRLVVDAVKTKKVPAALAALGIMNKRAATPIRKTLESAIANATNNLKLNKEDLVVKSIFVNEGMVYKRFHYAGRGRTRPYKRRSSHLTVVLETIQKQQVMKAVTPTAEKIEVLPKKEEKQPKTSLAARLSGRGKKGEK